MFEIKWNFRNAGVGRNDFKRPIRHIFAWNWKFLDKMPFENGKKKQVRRVSQETYVEPVAEIVEFHYPSKLIEIFHFQR